MYRVYFFDQYMNIIEYTDRVVRQKPHQWAKAQVRKHGYYTYAIGALS